MKYRYVEKTKLRLRFDEATGNIHPRDVRKLNEKNFPVALEGNWFMDFQVGEHIVRRRFSTYNKNSACYMLF